MKIKIIKFRDDVKLPNRAHYNDAGADVFAPEDVTVLPNKVNMIPLGLGLELPDGFAAFIWPKTSLSSKGLMQMMPPIDSGFKGEITSIMFNVSSEPYTFKKGEKIGQLVVLPILLPEFVEELGEERGEGKFGSTGK